MDFSNICQCSGSIIKDIVQCRGSCYDCNGNNCSNTNLKSSELHIQDQAGIPSSQYANVLSSFTVGKDLMENGRRNYSKEFNYPNRNLSDRYLGSVIKTSSIIPTRGNSTKSSITSHKPGSSNPGGKGVDVKHGSYARHLAILNAKNIKGSNIKQPFSVNPKAIINNKSYKFTIIRGNCYCKN